MKSYYFKFVNFIQTMPAIWFYVIWAGLFILTITLLVKFFKKYTGEQSKFEKFGVIIVVIVLFAILIYLTNIRI